MGKQTRYNVIGLMSGTSLDGLDLVYCKFTRNQKNWNFEVSACETRPYPASWHKRLSTAHLMTGLELQLLDSEYGHFIGAACHQFIKKNGIQKTDFIASHGHTVFHQPDKKLTYQIGNGLAIAHGAGLPVINDFRSLDVFKGGQGAPLVPIGDHLLFPRFDICLNLGGIANLSMIRGGKRIAHDICFANMGLNHLANRLGKKFDKGGKGASRGKINEKMLRKLNGVYGRWRNARPSLGREGFENFLMPILGDNSLSVEDRLRTFCESICVEIEKSVPLNNKKYNLLATGGGALNTFLITALRNKFGSRVNIIVPEDVIVKYKEAIVFAFLGVLRVRNETNVLKSVTGAASDSCAGTLLGF